MTRKKHLWIPLTIMLLASIALASVPVKPDTSETRLSVRESPPGSWIPGVAPNGEVWVTIDIETPDAWDNTADGIVGWVFSVRVDPIALTPWSVSTADFDYFLYEWCDWNFWTNYTLSPPPGMNASHIVEFGEMMVGSPPIGLVGAGGNSTEELYGLCRIRFRSQSLVAYTVIDIYDAYWVDINEVKHPFDVVADGQYNEKPTYEANMVRRAAWPEHHHFVRSKDGWANVTDSHDTPGNLSLYAKIRNDGTINVTVRAEFNLTFGLAEWPLNPLVTDEVEIEPGQIIVIYANFSTLDGDFIYNDSDDGKWYVEAFCKYYDGNTETWEIGTRKTKTTAFTIVN